MRTTGSKEKKKKIQKKRRLNFYGFKLSGGLLGEVTGKWQGSLNFYSGREKKESVLKCKQRAPYLIWYVPALYINKKSYYSYTCSSRRVNLAASKLKYVIVLLTETRTKIFEWLAEKKYIFVNTTQSISRSSA